MNTIFRIIIVVLVVTFSGCDVNVNAGIRSGTIENDNIEEPLSILAEKYENALKTSNKLMRHLINNEYEAIANNLVVKELKEVLTKEALEKYNSNILSNAGAIKQYKKKQWGFVPATENGKDLLFSFKIVEHEKMSLNYAFVFINDGKYNKLAGFQIQDRNGARSPNSLK